MSPPRMIPITPRDTGMVILKNTELRLMMPTLTTAKFMNHTTSTVLNAVVAVNGQDVLKLKKKWEKHEKMLATLVENDKTASAVT